MGIVFAAILCDDFIQCSSYEYERLQHCYRYFALLSNENSARRIVVILGLNLYRFLRSYMFCVCLLTSCLKELDQLTGRRDREKKIAF